MRPLVPTPPSAPGRSSGRLPSPDPFDLLDPWAEGDTAFDLRRYGRMLRRYWPLALVTFALVAAATAARFTLTPPVYEARATLQIERRSLAWAGSRNALEMMIEDSWNTEFYPTQYELIRTSTLGERVVRDQDLAAEPDFAGDAPPDEWQVRRLGRKLIRGLRVEPRDGTQLVDLTAQARTAELAVRIANGVAESFIDWRIEAQSAVIRTVGAFLDTQIAGLEADVRRLEEQLGEVAARTETAAPLAEGELQSNQQIRALSDDYATAVSRRIEQESKFRMLESSSVESLLQLAAGRSVEDLRRRLVDLEDELASNSEIYLTDAPPMLELRERIRRTREELSSELEQQREQARRDYEAALQSERSLASQIQETTSRLGSTSLELSSLTTATSTRRALLHDLVGRRSELQVLERVFEGRQSNVRLVERAYPPAGPVSPSLNKALATGGFGGLALGLAVALLAGHLDRSLDTTEDAEECLGLVTLATIPDLDPSRRGYAYAYRYGRPADGPAVGGLLSFRRRGPKELAIELVPHLHPELAISEAYRSLATALLLSSAEELRSVAVTSAEPGEGKSVTSLNLATVFAQLGMRILLLDADFRKPHLHRILGVEAEHGAVSFLAQRAPVEEVVHPTRVQGIDLCPTGPTPPNPFALVASQRMGQLLEWARSQYDFVIVDTPPVLAVPDAAFLGTFTDGSILCLQAGRTTRERAKSCRDQLRLAGVRLLGTVLNRARAHLRYGGYAYSYAYTPSRGAAARREAG